MTTKIDGCRLRQRTKEDVYAKIIECLTKPMSCREISETIQHYNGSVVNMLQILTEVGYVIRERPKGIYLYTRTVERTTTVEVYSKRNGGMLFGYTEKTPTLPGARIIDFNKDDLRRKVRETNEMTRKNKRLGKNYVSGSTLDWV